MGMESVFTILGLNLIWQTTFVSLLVFVALKSLPRTEAKMRYYISLSGLLGIFLLLIAPFTPAVFETTIPASFTPTILGAANDATVIPANMFANLAPHNAAQTAVAPTIRLSSLTQIGNLLLMLWGLGAIVALLVLVQAGLQGRGWIRNAVKIAPPTEKALSRDVDIYESQDVFAPLVLGFIRPVILVPVQFDSSLTETQTRAVLEHEIAHIQRGDLYVNLAQRILLALLWWCLPLHWVNQQISVEREKLCDDIAKTKLGAGRALAYALVDLADAQIQQRNLPLAIGIYPRANQLAERIQRLVKENSMPKTPKKTLFAASMLVPLALSSMAILAPRAFAGHQNHEALERGEKNVSEQERALFNAVSARQLDQARALMQTGTNPNFVVPGDGTPLIIAASAGSLEMVKLLLQHGADINTFTDSDESALINAVRGGHLDVVETLVRYNADVSLGRLVNTLYKPEWRSPLSESQKYGRTEISAYLQSLGAVADNRGAKKPDGTIVEGRLSSPFGVVRTRFGNTPHKGIDIAAKPGTPIYAPADGKIIEVTSRYKDNPNWGHVVVVRTDGGVETIFAHLQDSQVQANDIVIAGTQIARVGNTGKSTGPHVHIQTMVDGQLTDPRNIWASLPKP